MPDWLSSIAPSWFQRWWRRNINRDALMDFLKLMPWVAGLTLVIWYFAVNEQFEHLPGQPIPIVLKSADPNHLVRLGGLGDETVIADLDGPRAKLDYVKEEWNKNPVVITVPATLQPGSYPLLTSQFIKDAPIFVSNGIDVSNIHPVQLPIVVDTLDVLEVPVQPPDPNNLSAAVFEPRTVQLRGPHQLLTSPEFKKDAIAVADISVNAELRRPGQHGPTTVPVISPLSRIATGRGENVSIIPSTVVATLTVQETSHETTINAMPVWVEAAPSLGDQFRVECDGFVKDVRVSGSRDQINKIGTPPYIPHATLTYNAEDAQAGGLRQRTLWFDNGSLPPGVTVSKEIRERPFSFTVVPRTKTP